MKPRLPNCNCDPTGAHRLAAGLEGRDEPGGPCPVHAPDEHKDALEVAEQRARVEAYREIRDELRADRPQERPPTLADVIRADFGRATVTPITRDPQHTMALNGDPLLQSLAGHLGITLDPSPDDAA